MVTFWSKFALGLTCSHLFGLERDIIELFRAFTSVWRQMEACGGLHVTIFVMVSDPSLRVDFALVRGVIIYLPYTPPMVPKGRQTLDKHELEPYRAYTSVWRGLEPVGGV